MNAPKKEAPPEKKRSIQNGCQSLVWTAWQKHAFWMLASYSRTGNFKHLEAFARHFHAMRQVSLQ